MSTNLTLYHFTSVRHLRGIAQHGLTVGDVPTDIRRNRGIIGVWLTDDPNCLGHGLEGSAADKTAYRLTVVIGSLSPGLVRWNDWAPKHVTPDTLTRLHASRDDEQPMRPDTWYVSFNVIPTALITACTDMKTGAVVEAWGEVSPPWFDVPAVPPWRRSAWQKNMLRRVAKQYDIAQRALTRESIVRKRG